MCAMITSNSNTQVKNLIQLTKKAKARKDQGLFVVEGKKMFSEAPREMMHQVYVSESFLASPENNRMLEGISYEVLSDQIFKSVSDTQTPQGVLCLMKMPHYILGDLYRGEKTHLLILESIQDPGNLGTMLRTGEGAGISGILLNRTTVDIYNPKTIRSTMGSIYRVPFFITDDLSGALRELQEEGVQLYAAHLKGTMSYDEPDYRRACGFLIGNEGNGLSEEIAEAADCYIRIPMEGQVESLNASIAATLLMYEVNRQRRAPKNI